MTQYYSVWEQRYVLTKFKLRIVNRELSSLIVMKNKFPDLNCIDEAILRFTQLGEEYTRQIEEIERFLWSTTTTLDKDFW